MAIVWGVFVTVWLVRWFAYFARFSMAQFSAPRVELLGIFFFGSFSLIGPSSQCLELGRFLGKSIRGIACRGILPRRARLPV